MLLPPLGKFTPWEGTTTLDSVGLQEAHWACAAPLQGELFHFHSDTVNELQKCNFTSLLCFLKHIFSIKS